MNKYISIQKLTAISFAIISLYQPAQSSDCDLYEGQNPSTKRQHIPEELYQQALNFRDNKVPGYSVEQSRDEAEMLFLQMAEDGNSKAMHNYALMQYRKGDFECAYQWFKKSGLEASQKNCKKMLEKGEVKQDLYLVVASRRYQGASFGHYIDQVYGHSDTDLTHINTFNGKATTMDLLDSALPSFAHIKDDATQFDFFGRYDVKKVLIEQFPTLTENFSNRDFSNASPKQSRQITKVNYMGSCIEQISKAMKPGAQMDIEWLPYLCLDAGETDFRSHIANNPFNGFFNLNVALQSIFILGGDTDNINILPKDMVCEVLKLSKKVQEYLTFYHTYGAENSTEDLIELVYYEARVILNFFQRGPMVLLDYNCHLQDAEKLKTAYKTAIFSHFPSQLVKKKIAVKNTSGQEQCGIVYDRSSFQIGTLFNFLMTDISAEYNIPQVTKYMNSVGFKDTTIKKGTNPYTKRKNVWMIKATKS